MVMEAVLYRSENVSPIEDAVMYRVWKNLVMGKNLVMAKKIL
jgi:hypothetical protein